MEDSLTSNFTEVAYRILEAAVDDAVPITMTTD